MFTNIGAYPKTTLFGSKKNYGLQNDLAYKLKESVNNYHNMKIKNKTQKEAPYEHVSSSFDDDEDNSNYYENFIHKLVGSNNASTQIEHAKRKTNTCNIKSNKYEMYNNNSQLVNTFQDKKKYLNYIKGDSSGGSGNSGNKKRYLKTKKAITSNNVSFHNSNGNNNNKKEKSNFTDGLMAFNQKFKEVKSINIKRKGADILKKVLSEVSQEQNNNKNNINNQQSNNNHLAVPSILKHTHTESSSRLKKQRETETPQTLVLNRRAKHSKNNEHMRKVSVENEAYINTKSNKSQCSNNTNRNCIGCTQLLPTQNFLEIKKEESFCIRKHKGSGSPKKNISNTSVAICNNSNNNNNNDKQVNNCRRSDIKRTTEIPRRKNECNSMIKCKYNQNEIKLRRNASDEGIRKRINHLKRISGNGIHYSNISQSNNNNKRTQRENDNNNNNNNNEHNNNSNKTKKPKPKPKIIQSKTPDTIRAHNNNNKEKKKSKYFCCFNI